MIYLALSAVGEDVSASLPQEILDYISLAKSATLKESRCLTYRLLFSALKGLFPDREFSVRRTEFGKPYLVDGADENFSAKELQEDGVDRFCAGEGEKEKIHISLSHTDTLVAVCISDECEVGVDIEVEINSQRAARIEERYFKKIDFPSEFLSDFPTPAPMLAAQISDIQSLDISTINDSAKISVADRWSLCEALLKCEGGGFASFTRVSELIASCLSYLYRIDYKGTAYSLAVAVPKNK